MSSITLKESNQYYRSKLNTYSFNLVSATDTTGKCTINIPPFPLPTHQASSLAIFKLKEFYICGQDDTAGERAGGLLTKDLSGFIVRFSGLGLRGTNFSNAMMDALTYQNPTPSPDFIVINKYGALDRSGTDVRDSLQVNSGNGYLTQEVVCSNPTGTSLEIEVRDLDDQEIIINANYFFYVRFEVEVIPDEIGRGEVN